MGRLYMKENIWSNLDEFTVKNAEEDDCYRIHGDFVVVGTKKLHIEDMTGREMAMVQRKLFSLMPTYFVYRDGQKAAEIVKKLSLIGAKYQVKGLGWEVRGNITDHDYTITDGREEILRLHKVWLSWGASYELDIADGADEVMVLAVVLAINCVMQAEAEAAMETHDDNP